MVKAPRKKTPLQMAVEDVELHLDEVQKRNPKEVSDEQLEKMVMKLRAERAAWVKSQKKKGKDE